jgi:CelD/BcsL family acetyltransferase involved in cellulose biosynthesis
VERGNGLGAVYDIRRVPSSRRVDGARGANDVTSAVLEGGVELIDRLGREWLELCSEGPCNEPFYRPEWVAAYLRAFEPKSRLVVATARVNGRLRAVLPLIRERGRLYGMPVRRLRSAANSHSCRFDFVHGVGDAAQAARAVWRALQILEDWDVIELCNVPTEGAARLLLAAAHTDGHLTGASVRTGMPYLTLPAYGSDPETALAHLSPRHRRTLRSNRRKLGELGPVRLMRIERPRQHELERFYELERSGWKGARGIAIACAPETRRFFDELARLTGLRGSVTLWALECGRDAVAMQYGVTYGWTYFGLRTAYDYRFAGYSPGHLLMDVLVRDALARGLRAVDFTSGSDDFTSRWCSGESSFSSYHVFGKGLAARLLYLQTRKRFTPGMALERRLRHFGA